MCFSLFPDVVLAVEAGRVRIIWSFRVRGASTWNAMGVICFFNQGTTSSSFPLECSVRDSAWSTMRSIGKVNWLFMNPYHECERRYLADDPLPDRKPK